MHTDAPHISSRTAVGLTAALVLGIAALIVLLIPAPGSARHAYSAPAVPAHAVHAGGTAVSSTLDASTDDAAFLADLFDGAATDLTPGQADALTYTAHRICDLLSNPAAVPPGAERPTRAAVLASLTVGPHALTPGEASKLVDTAHAAYCPQAPWTGRS